MEVAALSGCCCAAALLVVGIAGGVVWPLLRGRTMSAALDKSFAEHGFGPHGRVAWVGQVDDQPVLVWRMPSLGRADGSGFARGSLTVMVPLAVGPGGECYTSRDRRARSPRASFENLFHLGPGVGERLPEAARDRLMELAAAGGELVDWQDARACQGRRAGWGGDAVAFLSGTVSLRAGVADVVARARALQRGARALEASLLG